MCFDTKIRYTQLEGIQINQLKKNWWVIAIVILVAIGIVSILWGHSTTPDPNASIMGQNDPDLREFVGDEQRIFLSGMDETFNSSDIGIVEFWVNSTLLENITLGYILYFDGTHSQLYNDSIPFDDDDQNERYWWTGYQLFHPNIFDPSQPTATDTYTILRRAAGSVITYQLRLQSWNDTHWIKESYNRTYTVLFTPDEVELEIDHHRYAFYYISIDCVLLIVTLFVSQPWNIRKPDSELKADPGYPRFNLEVGHLITRSGHLEAQIGSIRTGASILLTLGTGIFLWFTSLETTSNSIVYVAMIMAPFCLIILSFVGFIWSFASLVTEEDGHRLEMSLLPNMLSKEIYKSLLVKAVKRREEVISKSIEYVRTGINLFFICIIWSIILLPWDVLLPNVQIFRYESSIQVPYWVSVFLSLMVSIYAVITINRRLKLDMD